MKRGRPTPPSRLYAALRRMNSAIASPEIRSVMNLRFRFVELTVSRIAFSSPRWTSRRTVSTEQFKTAETSLTEYHLSSCSMLTPGFEVLPLPLKFLNCQTARSSLGATVRLVTPYPKVGRLDRAYAYSFPFFNDKDPLACYDTCQFPRQVSERRLSRSWICLCLRV